MRGDKKLASNFASFAHKRRRSRGRIKIDPIAIAPNIYARFMLRCNINIATHRERSRRTP
jgi:hypothetical protein